MSAKTKSNKSVVIVIASIAATGGLLFGFDTGVISGAIPFLQDYFEKEFRSGSAKSLGKIPNV